MRPLPPTRLENGAPTRRTYNPIQRWPIRDGYRTAERFSDVAMMPAEEVPDTTVHWLWPGVIPFGHLTLVAGESNSGKTFWMTDLAARVTFARPWPCTQSRAVASKPQPGTAERVYSSHHAPRDGSSSPQATPGQPHAEHDDYGGLYGNPNQGSVVFVNSDDALLDVQRPRLAAADAQLTYVGLMRRMPPGSRFAQFNSVGPIDERLKSLKAAIQEAGDCKLAIVDDLARFVRNGLGKVTRADLMLALEHLRCLAAECDVAMIVVWRLERTGRATARYLETFLPSAAIAWLVGVDPYRPETRWVAPLKNQFAPLPEPMAFHLADNHVVWDAPPGNLPGDVMAAFVRKSDRRLEREQAGRWALARLAEGPVEANQLWDEAEAFGFSRRTVRRALVDLGLKPTKVGNDGPWLWGSRQGSGFGVQGGEQNKDETRDEEKGTRRQRDVSLEDGQLASADALASGRKDTAIPDIIAAPANEARTDAEDGTRSVPATLIDDGQLEDKGDEMDRAEESAADESEAVPDDDERIVIVTMHRNVPGATLAVEDCQPGAPMHPPTSGP